MRVTKRDRYSLTKELSEFSESELQDLKFALNFRWIAHLKKQHLEASDSARAVTDSLRRELAKRIQARHLEDALKA